jgi:photosystem II stability/assembly factor-like uncharacterized protein
MAKIMKKILLVLGIIIAGGVLAGCSLIPQSGTTPGNAGFTMAQDIWRSDDAGATWQAKTKGEGKANVQDFDVLSFAVNPMDGNNVYAGLRSGGILATTDGGETWKFVNFQSEKVYGLAFSPADGRTLYVSGVFNGRGKIFSTTDGGQNWKEIYTSPSNGPLVISLTTDRKSPGTIYATTSDNEAIKSLDGGASWKNINSANSPILKIAVDAGSSNLLYFATLSGTISRSQDGGGTFADISQNISKSLSGNFGGGNFSVVAADPARANRVYVAGQGGIARSDDGGETWSKISVLNNAQNFPVKVLAIDPRNSANIIYGAAQASYRSTDGGATWTTSQFNVNRTVNVLAYNTSNPNVVYLGFSK